jgi:hypothetical protein
LESSTTVPVRYKKTKSAYEQKFQTKIELNWSIVAEYLPSVSMQEAKYQDL